MRPISQEPLQRHGARLDRDPDRHRRLQKMQMPEISIIGMTIRLHFTSAIRGELRLCSAGQLASRPARPRHTDVRGVDLVHAGIVLTVLAHVPTVIFCATAWHWLSHA
jgi:hypothetical protein